MTHFDKDELEAALRPGLRWLKVALAAAILLFVLKRSFVVVSPGERAVIFSQMSGVLPFTLAEGIHFVWPVVWQPVKYDVKTMTYTMSKTHSEGEAMGDDSLPALTSDGLTVWLDLSVRFHVDPDQVWKLHQEVGPDYREKIVRPQARSLTRMVVAGYPVVDVYAGRRQQIIAEVNERLKASFAASYLVLDELLLRNISFSQAFQAAIERKQVAMQEAIKMDYVLQQASKEKERKIVEAQGEAQAIRLVADALQRNPNLIRYEYVRNLPADAKVVVTNSQTIVSLGDVLRGGEAK